MPYLLFFASHVEKAKNPSKIPVGIPVTLDKMAVLCYTLSRNIAKRSRRIMPKGRAVRKVRASQGRITDNISRG